MSYIHIYRSSITISIHYGMCLGPYGSQMCVIKLYRAQNQCVRSVAHTSTADRIAYRFLMYYQMLCDESTTKKTVGNRKALTILM